MSTNIFSVLCLLFAVYCIYGVNSASTEYDDTYYNRKTKVVNKKVEGIESVNPSKLIAFSGGHCDCKNLACSCCTGVRVKLLKFDEEACAVLQVLSQNIGIGASITLNQKQIYSTSVSLSNPPPICVKVPDFPAVQVCLRFYNLQVTGKKLNVCADFETHVSKLPTLVLHFNCVQI